jgi:hypothetical protein
MSGNSITYKVWRKKSEKQLKSLRNKMVPLHIIWWDSLSVSAQYSLLHKWNLYKKINYSKKIKLKHFLNENKQKYKPLVSNQRNTIIEHLIDN